jgi:Fic family protein
MIISKSLESLGDVLDAMKVLEPPAYGDILSSIRGDRVLALLTSETRFTQGDADKYVHWDKLRHLSPPDGLTHEEWWFAIKSARRSALRPLPLQDAEARPFVYSTPDVVWRHLHYIDQRCSGEIAMPAVVTTDSQAQHRYLVNSLMEEAIRSSQLEGATTSRRVAKEMLRSGRPPQDRSERMILNNYRALRFMREVDRRLTPEIVLELQRILTEGTLDNPDAAGRLQRPDEERVAVWFDGQVVHEPPPAEQLPARLQALCDFANEPDTARRFVHPVVRAILLHFWLAYDHPFEDGNGRTARALFYWYMRTRRYWLVEYLSISRILRNAPAQYAKSFLLTETDDGDVTYFIDYQLGVIKRAITELHAYLARKAEEIRNVEQLLKRSPHFNHRQLALLGYALRTPDGSFTFRTHAESHGVTHETARNDLLPLVKKGLLERNTIRGRHIFTPQPDLADRLAHVS